MFSKIIRITPSITPPKNSIQPFKTKRHTVSVHYPKLVGISSIMKHQIIQHVVEHVVQHVVQHVVLHVVQHVGLPGIVSIGGQALKSLIYS